MIPMAKAFWLGLERSDMFIQFFSTGMEGDDWLQKPAGMANPAIWIIGHLAYNRGVFLKTLTGRQTYDASWDKLFGVGCARVDISEYPDIDSSRKFLADRLADFKEYFEHITQKELVSPLEPPSEFFPTKASLLAHMTHHEAHHTGSLSMIRQLLGKEKLI